MLNNLSIRYKNLLLVGLASLVVVVTVVLALSLTLDSVSNERRLMAKSLTEMAHRIVERKYQFLLEGKLESETQAKKSAVNALRSMSYGDHGYFFIYERSGKLIMDSNRAELEGSNQFSTRDGSGVKVIAELSSVTSKGKGGFVSYDWKRPSDGKTLPKISYAKGFEQWDWMIGTGSYEADVQAQVVGLVKRNVSLVVLSAVVFIALVVSLFVINGNTLKQVFLLQKHLAFFAEGNFSNTVPKQGKDEFGHMFDSMECVQKSMNKTLSQLGQTAGSVGSGATEISNSNQSLAMRTEKQASNLARSSRRLSEISGMVRQNSDNLSEASELAKQSQETVVKGESVVQEAVGAMSRITASSGKVTEIVNVIDEISFQTNLLALNAAVEAARAGDQGRGFAVVASEVRTLAQRSATSANEIKELIEESTRNVHAGSKLVSASGGILKEILESSRQVSVLIEGISTSTKEQTISIEKTSQSVGDVDEFIQQNAAMVEEVAVSSASLTSEVESLMELVGYFEIKGER